MTYINTVFKSTLAALLMAVLFGPQDAEAQGSMDNSGVTIEVSGGTSMFSRFLEERVDGVERELRAGKAGNVQVALGYHAWEQASLRVFGSFSPSDFHYDTDNADGSDALESDGLESFDLWTFGVEALRFIDMPIGPLAPYAGLGLVATTWDADSEHPDRPLQGLEKTHVRFGMVTSAGMQIQAGSNLALRFEASALAVKNPFDGHEAMSVANPEQVFDEPETAPIVQLTGGVAYTL